MHKKQKAYENFQIPRVPEVGRLLKDVALSPDRIHLALPGVEEEEVRSGHHSHDAWELMVPVNKGLRFEAPGRELLVVEPGRLLMIPPGYVHMGINLVARQPKDLDLLVVSLPGSEVACGGISFGGLSSRREHLLLSAEGESAWCALLGGTPAGVLDRAAEALVGGGWTAERGAALVRLVLCTFAEAAAMASGLTASRGEQKILRAVAILNGRFYEPDLSLAGVAAEVGLSPTHMATRFKAVTGRTFWKTIVDLRLSRARALLEAGRHSVKEVAALTGWSSQLYFSAAFRRQYGVSPSRVKSAPGPAAG